MVLILSMSGCRKARRTLLAFQRPRRFAFPILLQFLLSSSAKAQDAPVAAPTPIKISIGKHPVRGKEWYFATFRNTGATDFDLFLSDSGTQESFRVFDSRGQNLNPPLTELGRTWKYRLEHPGDTDHQETVHLRPGASIRIMLETGPEGLFVLPRGSYKAVFDFNQVRSMGPKFKASSAPFSFQIPLRDLDR